MNRKQKTSGNIDRYLFSVLVWTVIFPFLLWSCSSNQQDTATEQEVIPEVEHYALTGEAVNLKWTAYKFTEKAGVSGTFDSVSSVASNNEGTIEELLRDAAFNIKTRSVNTNMPPRDDRIYNSLFVTIGAETISGKFTTAGDAGGELMITMGAHSGPASYTYTHSADTITINTTIDLVSWKAQAGVDALNEACSVEHIGADGVSKLWPDVDIEVKVPIRQVVTEMAP